MPPVLPCLQANKGLPHETNIVCGWECYFNKNPEQCHLTENRSSLGMAFFQDFGFIFMLIIGKHLPADPKKLLEIGYNLLSEIKN